MENLLHSFVMLRDEQRQELSKPSLITQHYLPRLQEEEQQQTKQHELKDETETMCSITLSASNLPAIPITDSNNSIGHIAANHKAPLLYE